MGVGMVAITAPPQAAAEAVRTLAGRGIKAWVAGEIVAGDGTVELSGGHAG